MGNARGLKFWYQIRAASSYESKTSEFNICFSTKANSQNRPTNLYIFLTYTVDEVKVVYLQYFTSFGC